jgi:hypothetical protein
MGGSFGVKASIPEGEVKDGLFQLRIEDSFYFLL